LEAETLSALLVALDWDFFILVAGHAGLVSTGKRLPLASFLVFGGTVFFASREVGFMSSPPPPPDPLE
jgi:hypothetical protein